MDDWVWMRHGTGVPALFPPASVTDWTLKGWERCAAPGPDPDPALVEWPRLEPPAEPPTDEETPEETEEPDDDEES